MLIGLGRMIGPSHLAGDPTLTLHYPFSERLSLTPRKGPTLTFTRASNATMFDSAGTLVFAPHNLALQSDDFATTWTLNNLTATDGATSPAGDTTADTLDEGSGGTTHRAFQSIAITPGATFTFSVFVKNVDRQFVLVSFGSGVNTLGVAVDLSLGTITQSLAVGTATIDSSSIQDVGNGWFRVSVTGDVPGTTPLFPVISLSNKGTGLVDMSSYGYSGSNKTIQAWGAQLNQGSLQDYSATTTAAFYGPRFTHDPVTGASLGLLIEEARTNLLLQSEDFSTTWVDSAVTPVGISTNTTVAPDGNTTADTLTDDSAVNFEGLEQTITVANNSTPWTATVYIKKDSDETRFPELQIKLTGGTLQRVNVSLNTSTGAILERSSTGTTVVSVQDAGDYWRLRVTVDNNTTGNVTLEVFLFPAAGSTLGTIVASATGSIIAWGVQLENAGHPLSYISTTTAAVTRSLDVVGTTDVSWLNQSEGTLLVEALQEALFGAADYLIQIDDGGSSDRVFLVVDTNDKVTFNTTNSGGNNGSSVAAAIVVAGTSFKAIGAYAQDNVVAGKDGVLDATPDTTADFPTADTLTTVRIGDSHAGDRTLNGTIAEIKYWNVEKIDAFLQSEST